MSEFEYPGEVRPPVNVLAARYASPDMVRTFSDDAKVYFERGLWIAVMEEQAALGLDIPADAIEAYRQVQPNIDHDSMRRREEVSRHDVNSRIEEFNALAGHQFIQLGMTSRDLTENVEQLQIRLGLDIIHDRIVATLGRFASRVAEYSTIAMAGRSHNVAAQTITLAKRFSNSGEELLLAYDKLNALRGSYPIRGIKGPVGTQQDMLDLFGGDANKVSKFEKRVSKRLGFTSILGSVGQVYPRSLDLDVITALQQAAAGPSSFAKTFRLMAGNELVTEGFKKGQVGSNAMPHKMNAPTSERISSLYALLAGYATTAGHLAGDQWNEGDVSCSAARRVIIPDSFFVADGVFQSTMKVLDNMGAYPQVIANELERYLPFLTTTKALMAAVKAGVGRETAHEIIKEHAVAVALQMREQGTSDNDLFDRLANDPRLPISKQQLIDAIGNPLDLTGLAQSQTAHFVGEVQQIIDKYPNAARYKPTTLV